MYDNEKILHIFGEVYPLDEKIGVDEYRTVEFTGAYLTIEDSQELGGKFFELIYNNGNQVYEDNKTTSETEGYCNHYFNGKGGTEFDIFSVTEDTPCGDYWCNIA